MTPHSKALLEAEVVQLKKELAKLMDTIDRYAGYVASEQKKLVDVSGKLEQVKRDLADEWILKAGDALVPLDAYRFRRA